MAILIEVLVMAAVFGTVWFVDDLLEGDTKGD